MIVNQQLVHPEHRHLFRTGIDNEKETHLYLRIRKLSLVGIKSVRNDIIGRVLFL